MTHIQYKGSEESDNIIAYSGTWEQTKKIRRVTAVHSTFWLKRQETHTLWSGEETSGKFGRKGQIRLRNVEGLKKQVKAVKPHHYLCRRIVNFLSHLSIPLTNHMINVHVEFWVLLNTLGTSPFSFLRASRTNRWFLNFCLLFYI